MKTTLYTPFIEAGFSPDFAQFCILHDLQVEWTRDTWNDRLRVELLRMVEPSAAAYRIARPKKVREVVSCTVIDSRELHHRRGNDLARYLEEELKGHASEYLLQAKGVKPSEYADAHDAMDELRANVRPSDYATGYIGSSAFMEKLIRAEHDKKRRQADADRARRGPPPGDDHASDAFRYAYGGGMGGGKTAGRDDDVFRFFEEMMKQRREAGDFFTFKPDPTAGKSFTKEQQAARTRARKIKALMNGTTHDGERASAKSRLDSLLSKHQLTEADI